MGEWRLPATARSKKGESHKVFDMMERLTQPDERTSGTEPVAVHDRGE